MGKSNIAKELREILGQLEEIQEHLEDVYERCVDIRDEISDEFEDSSDYIDAEEMCENLADALEKMELIISDVESCAG